jgi:hypothetical protein
VLQAHAIQVQTLQNELESLRAQLLNLKGKSSQPTSHAQHVQSSGSREGPPRSFYGVSHDAMVGEYVLFNAHNSSFTPEFAIFFCPSYFVAQKASVAPRVSTTRQVIQAMDSHLVQVLLLGLKELEHSCHNLFVLSTQKKNTPCWRGGKRLLHHKLLRHQIFVSQEYMYIRKTHNFSINKLMECQLQMREVVQKLVTKALVFKI